MAEAARIRRLDALGEREIDGLCGVLIDCVEGGASVNFMLPMTRAKAEVFWQRVAASLARGERLLLVAEDDTDTIVGTVQLIWAVPENQPHRAELAKLLVHRRARGRGVGAALLAAAELAAQDAGKTLLVLETMTGSAAERLYRGRGWLVCGHIPDYALWPGGGLGCVTLFYKTLSEASASRLRESADASLRGT